MPQPAPPSKTKLSDKNKDTKFYAPKLFDPVEHGQVKRRGWIFLFCGVILPTAALVFETIFHFCAHYFFDPFPTSSHVVLFGLIPFSNFLVWLGTRKDLSNHYAFMSLASGMAMGVSCLYSLMFLPLTPLSCFFTLALGFGLLGLAPLLSLPCNMIAGKTVCKLASRKGTYFNAHQFEHMGHMIILVMVVAIELPSTLTRINLVKAADANPIESSAGISWLRRYGSPEVLLRSCYERSGKATDILGSLYESAHHTSVEQNRKVFFKVTGKPYNSVPIPKAARATIQHAGVISNSDDLNAGVDDEFDIDTDIAGEEVAGVARGLSISQSELTGKVDSKIALANFTWSFDFTNDSKFDREARGKILLPPHAVATKASLTIDNVERDATIMVRSLARARYKKAVQEHKDPLLVSTCGSDQILVQCYPVKPGQTVKVKLQYAAPMTVDNNNRISLMMPAFTERNFQVDHPIKVEIKSDEKIIAGELKSVEATNAGSAPQFVTAGSIENAQLACFGNVISSTATATPKAISYKISELPSRPTITRNLKQKNYREVKNLLIIVDGSAAMQSSYPQIGEAIKALPATLNAQIKVVGDITTELYPGVKEGLSTEVLAAGERLKEMKAEGGQDDSAALLDSLTVAAMTDNMSVLWLHAAQPLSNETARVQSSLKGTNRPLLFDMQVLAGPNEILSGVNQRKSLVRINRTGSLKEDLVAFFNTCSNGEPATKGESPSEPEYVLREDAATENSATQEVDKRLGQIWANERIAQDLQDPGLMNSAEPGTLAQSFQIISPVSSAIVTDPDAALATKINKRKQYLARINKPMNKLSSFRRQIAQEFGVDRKVTSISDTLNSLSSASSTAIATKSTASAVPAPAPGVSGDVPRSADMDQNKNFRMQGFNQQPAPFAKDMAETKGAGPVEESNAKEVSGANEADNADEAGNLDKLGTTIDANGNTVDADGKPVPEADTWMLLSLLALIFGGTWWSKNKRRKAHTS